MVALRGLSWGQSNKKPDSGGKDIRDREGETDS